MDEASNEDENPQIVPHFATLQNNFLNYLEYTR